MWWISKDECERRLALQKAAHERQITRLKEKHEQRENDFAEALRKAGLIKGRGRPPDNYEDRYVIQVYADAKILHPMVRGGEKRMVGLLAEQFAHEAEMMLLALSGLERIPMVPCQERGGWVAMEELK